MQCASTELTRILPVAIDTNYPSLKAKLALRCLHDNTGPGERRELRHVKWRIQRERDRGGGGDIEKSEEGAYLFAHISIHYGTCRGENR